MGYLVGQFAQLVTPSQSYIDQRPQMAPLSIVEVEARIEMTKVKSSFENESKLGETVPATSWYNFD